MKRIKENGASVTAAAISGVDTSANMVANLEATITPRQLELLALVASGYTYIEIGARKFLTPHAVQKSLVRARTRTGARNVTHLCLLLREANLIRYGSGGLYEPVGQDLRIAE